MADINPQISAIGPSTAQVFSYSGIAVVGDVWEASAGSPTSYTVGSSSFAWTSPATQQTVTITFKHLGVVQATRLIAVTSNALTYAPSIAVEGTEGGKVILHTMENGVRRGRTKTSSKRRYELKFNNRDATEFGAVRTLYNTCLTLLPFFMNDPITGAQSTWYFDSDMAVRYGGLGCSIDYSFRVV